MNGNCALACQVANICGGNNLQSGKRASEQAGQAKGLAALYGFGRRLSGHIRQSKGSGCSVCFLYYGCFHCDCYFYCGCCVAFEQYAALKLLAVYRVFSIKAALEQQASIKSATARLIARLNRTSASLFSQRQRRRRT